MERNRFMEEVDKEISEMKLSLNARARVVAESYLLAVCLNVAIWFVASLAYLSFVRSSIRKRRVCNGHHPRLMMDGDGFAHVQVHHRDLRTCPSAKLVEGCRQSNGKSL